MLYKYKNDYEKIAMGLLSFIPDLKEISHLKSCFEWYRAEDDRHLYFGKMKMVILLQLPALKSMMLRNC